MKFRQPYDDTYNSSDYATPVGYELDSEPDKQMQNALEASATEQAHARETDINVIMDRAKQTGVLPQGTGPSAFYGDLTDMPTYLEAQIIVANANQAFAEMPSELRDRFNNDPSKLLAFMDNPDNAAEAERLGLVPRSSVVAEPNLEAVVETTENAS